MDAASLTRLILLAALWGASFLFLRMGAPVFGAGWIIELRVAIAFVFLLAVGQWLTRRQAVAMNWRRNWRHYALLGFFNSALPFLFFAFAAKSLPAGILSIFNSTAPIWGALLGLLFLGVPVTPICAAGMAMGVAGVAVLTLGGGASMPEGSTLALTAAALAPLCYAIASALSKRFSQNAGAFENACGSMGASALMVAPFCLAPFSGNPDASAWGAAFALGIFCTGAAYLLYFRLIHDVGPTKALSVTFLIPVFGTLWGVLFLNEIVTTTTLTGGAMILFGTVLTTGLLGGGRSAPA